MLMQSSHEEERDLWKWDSRGLFLLQRLIRCSDAAVTNPTTIRERDHRLNAATGRS
ncbi:hypothetical protein RS9916_26589 [Synechococcus sp. RS9916]|nr:hypothetical protein RS9916_26589 [Synechococcus sp. RS9916]